MMVIVSLIKALPYVTKMQPGDSYWLTFAGLRNFLFFNPITYVS